MRLVLGGGSQQGSLSHDLCYSVNARCIGKPSYLEPNRGSMQKSIEGTTRIGVPCCQWHVAKASGIYLERIRNRMHEPIEGLLTLCFTALNKGAIVFYEH